MGQEQTKESILGYALIAPITRIWGKYNGATTVARVEWLLDRGHPDKIKQTIIFDLLRLKLGTLNPSQFPISDYLEIYKKRLVEWLSVFGLDYPEHLTWWITPYSFDVQCETGQILVSDYSGDFAEWCIRHLRE